MTDHRISMTMLFAGLFLMTAGLAAQERATDQWLSKPVDGSTYQSYVDFFSYDETLPFETSVISTRENEGIIREHLSFQSTPGVRVFANYSRPSGGSTADGPALILLHGGSAAGKDAGYVEYLVELVVRAGFRALSIDMQYFGERSTDLLTTFTEEDKHDHLYNRTSVYLSWIVQNTKDISRSFDFLVRERGVDPARVGLFGISRGAQVGMIAGAVERRLAAVLLLHGGHFDRFETEHLPAACPANYIGRISPRPLLMVNGTQDTDYDKAASVDPLYELAKDPKQIIWVVDGGHMAMEEEHRSAMVKWLRQNVK
jgi:pimeloyl-ACP methyl ester carboxylesterase